MYSTVEVIGAIVDKAIGGGVTLFYEEVAPNAPFPYAVITNLGATNNDPYDTGMDITIDLWDVEPNATRLEMLCDTLRSVLNYALITTDTAIGRVNYLSQQPITDNEGNLIRRQQTYSARIFG